MMARSLGVHPLLGGVRTPPGSDLTRLAYRSGNDYVMTPRFLADALRSNLMSRCERVCRGHFIVFFFFVGSFLSITVSGVRISKNCYF